MIVLGHCRSPHGLKGGVRVRSYTRPPTNILAYKRLIINKDGEQTSFLLSHGHIHGETIVVYFDGITDRITAERLSGDALYVNRGELPSPGEKHYYWADLIGFEVLNIEGESLGSVIGFLETGGHDVLRVAGSRERLIPFVIKRYIVDVKIAKEIVVVDWHLDD